MSDAPVIVVGMHRSGTSMLIEALRRMGMFTGARLDKNGESIFFVSLNSWLMGLAGASWDRPAPIEEVLADEELRQLALDHVRAVSRSLQSIHYVGLGRYLRGETAWRPRGPWGWKDPRNTFTLPFWLELFPDARVLHIVRNGIDVARSLFVRERRALSRARERHERRARFGMYHLSVRQRRPIGGPRVLSLETAFRLWEQYTSRAVRLADRYRDQVLHVRYEDILGDPETELPQLARYAGLRSDATALKDAKSMLDPSRSFAFGDNPELAEFAAAHRDAEMLCRFGY